MTTVENRLSEMGITLETPAASQAKYKPCVQVWSQLIVSGQLPKRADGSLIVGVVGNDVSVELAREAARRCTVAILSEARAYLGSLDRIVRCVRLGGFVNAVPGFGDHPLIINEASQLMLDAFGEAGEHARVAMGVGGLPFNVAVEIEALFEIRI